MRILRLSILLCVPSGVICPQRPVAVPVAPSPEQIHALVLEVTSSQLQYMTHAGPKFRYQVHRVDPKEDTTRELIESVDGSVARLILHNGQPLTTAENEGEQHRLQQLLDSGGPAHDRKDDKRGQTYGIELTRSMPDAMLYTLTPGQPQLPRLDRPQIVLDYLPNPAFHATSLAEATLASLAGRLWIDRDDHHLVRMEIHINRDVNVAAGILIKVFSGGTIEYDQRRVAEGQYAYTHIRMHLRLRELMVKTVPYESDLTATDIQPLNPAPGGLEAIRSLLALPVTTR